LDKIAGTLDDADFLAAVNEEVEMPPDNPELVKLFDSMSEERRHPRRLVRRRPRLRS